MDEAVDGPTSDAGSRVRPEDVGHPRGTLVIVIAYAALFALGWLGLYLWRFVSQGAPN